MQQYNNPFPRDGRYLVVVIFASLLLIIGSMGVLQAQEPVLPQVTPNTGNGAALYQDRCANCHGDTGAGDGPMSPNMIVTPKNLSDPEYRKTADPAYIFNLITNGNLETGMPPFGPANSQNPINDDGRWDLVATVYTLSTPPEAIENGQALYVENCAACHGEDGLGDEGVTFDMTRLSYWYNRTNADVHELLTNSDIPEHDYDLTEDELWQVVDYGRSFSYTYIDPAAPLPAIANATITGNIVNGTTGDIPVDVEILLRAFTPEFEETFNQTTTIKTDGSYQFDLVDVPQEWIFIATASYQDLNFSSNANQFSPTDPVMDLPITVYNTTDDPIAVQIGQAHIVIDFVAEDRVAVTELYVFNNLSDAVFLGATGDPVDGTVQLDVPTNAENVSFERSFGGNMQNTILASEVIQIDNGWFDTMPLRPGDGASTLIVSYELPYNEKVELAHKLPYYAAHISLILPDFGLEVDGENWEFDGAQQMTGGSSFLSYSQAALESGSPLAFTLSGEPDFSSLMTGDGGGNNTIATSRNETTELIIGSVILGVVVAIAGYFIFSSRQQSMDDAAFDYDDEEVVVQTPAPTADDAVQALLQAIAKLDAAYEAGEVEEETYTEQRHKLKAELAEIWA